MVHRPRLPESRHVIRSRHALKILFLGRPPSKCHIHLGPSVTRYQCGNKSLSPLSKQPMSKDQETAVVHKVEQSWWVCLFSCSDGKPYLLHRWTRILFSRTKVPPPPPASLDDALLIPEANANAFNRLVFEWITPLLRLGFARPLEASDLWKLQDDRGAQHIARLIAESYDRRTIEANAYNERIEKGEVKPVLKAIWWSILGNKSAKMKEWKEKAKKRPSLVWAINDSVKWWFWSAGIFKIVGDVSQVTSPLVVKVSICSLLRL